MTNDIKKYTTKGGQTRYKFIIYVGVDDSTGRSIEVRRQGFKSESEAQKAYADYLNKIANGDYDSKKSKRLTFKELYEQWLKVYADTVKESTLATTMRMIDQHVLPEIGKIYIDKLTVFDCQTAVNHWCKDAPKTFKKYIRYAAKVLNYGLHLELINTNPMEKVIRPRIKKSKKDFDNFYSKDELRKFLIYAKQFKFKAFVFFRLLGYSGLRKGEAVALRWRDIDFKNNAVIVRSTVSKGLDNRLLIQSPKTESSSRTVSLDTQTMEILKQWQNEQRKFATVINIDSNMFVFEGVLHGYITGFPMSVTTASNWNNAICKAAHLKHISLHGFRHTHASLLFDAGIPMQEIKERLGHTSITTTMNVYTHVYKKRSKETANNFESYMNA